MKIHYIMHADFETIGIFPIRLTKAGQKDYLFSEFPQKQDQVYIFQYCNL